ncbi:MAG: AsnC family transcriptional regulator [Candidatus Bathyarchaeia archaeon]
MSRKLLDDIDKVIVSELQKDGRVALASIAKKIGVSHVAIHKRLERLIDKGVVKVSACLNVDRLDSKIAAILVEVENSRRLNELTELFKECPRTVLLSQLSATNLLTVVVGEDFSTLESVIGVCSLRVQKGVRRSEVYIGKLPDYPRFLPIRIAAEQKECSPCGVLCSKCDSFKDKECLGCPATKSYNGPL